MYLKTNYEWLEWGRRDPLFGVASWKDKDAHGAAPWTDDEFYALGESDWHDFEEHWRKYGLLPGVFVEIGCGAGRITKQLSAAFERGHALDVSEHMIRYASTHVTERNVEWHVTQGLAIPLEDNTVDAAFSCHVLQHFPTPESGYAYFREIRRTLKPGGTLMIHLPIHVFPAMVSQKFAVLCGILYRVLLRAVDVKSAYRRLRARLGGTPPMHGISYEQGTLYRTLIGMGFVRVEFLTFAVASNGGVHQFVMATKPAK
ncbi:MAG: class I SAM-dependent methyltransferase [Candidatus Acidiferrales bacterium]